MKCQAFLISHDSNLATKTQRHEEKRSPLITQFDSLRAVFLIAYEENEFDKKNARSNIHYLALPFIVIFRFGFLILPPRPIDIPSSMPWYFSMIFSMVTGLNNPLS